MMRFADLPIRRKVAAAILLTSTIVLMLTGAAFMTYEWATFRQAAVSHHSALARVIAENSTAAVRFHDRTEAVQLLGTLRADKEITAAVLYDAEGDPIATHGASALAPAHQREMPPLSHRFMDGQLVVFEPVIHDNRQRGTLCIVASLDAVHERFELYTIMMVAILVTASLIAFALSSQLQRRITEPVQELARTAQAIAVQQDYSMRATRYGNDELGALTDAFNRMLDEIKERDARLSANEERLRVALAAANLGTWRYHPERRESIVDENYRRIYELPAGDGAASSDDLEVRIHPDDRAAVRAALDRAVQSPDAQFFHEYRLALPSGAMRWVRDRGRVVRRPDGQVDYVTGALVDITDRKEAEEEVHRLNAGLEQRVAQRTAELQNANKELEAFTYSVSHDLRGPLRHIVGYAEMVRDDGENRLSEESRGYVLRVVAAAEKLNRILESLLSLSRIGRRPLVMQPTPLDEVVDSALREFEAEGKNRRIEWHREKLPTVECDPALMALLFSNLLSNALKYSRPRDMAVIEIGTVPNDGALAVFVRDNGIGFDPRFREKLFGVFERLHNASEFEGTGVGLAIVERIVRRHGGRIWAEGEPDRGATFYFTVGGDRA